MKYRKKPVVIEAVEWTGKEEDVGKVINLALKDGGELPNDGIHKEPGIGFTPPSGELSIPTLEGTMIASVGDYIIKGVQGEIYPCKPDIFEQTYDKLDNE